MSTIDQIVYWVTLLMSVSAFVVCVCAVGDAAGWWRDES